MKLRDELITEDLADGGMLIVDPVRHRSHSLAPDAAAVWRELAAGELDADQLARATERSRAVVDQALARFVEERLVMMPPKSRRDFLRSAAGVAGAAVGVVLVESIAIPTPIHAQSVTKKMQTS